MANISNHPAFLAFKGKNVNPNKSEKTQEDVVQEVKNEVKEDKKYDNASKGGEGKG